MAERSFSSVRLRKPKWHVLFPYPRLDIEDGNGGGGQSAPHFRPSSLALPMDTLGHVQ